ncbi:MAG: type secretion system protein [Mycobacterium sp.]|jgi:type IV pilus assembly protein PilB|nr:type secretion system protein [Mycobacterium sp.]
MSPALGYAEGRGPVKPRAPRRRLGEVLVEQGVLTAVQLETLLNLQAEGGFERKRLGRLAVEAGYATERQLASALAAALELRLVDPMRERVDIPVARQLPRAVAERNGVLPLARDEQTGRLIVAVTDPTNVFALDDVRTYLRVSELEVAVTTDADLRSALTRVWSLSDDGATAAVLSDLAEENSKDIEAQIAAGINENDDAPIVKLVDMILKEAVGQGASDVHIEPQPAEVVIRFRVDGQLRDVMTVPKAAGPSLASRLKIIAGLDIAERRRPQDGRARVTIGGENVDIRMSTLPAMPGESIVMRVLPRARDLPPLARVGLLEPQLEALLAAVRQPQGLVLITGPTGSGKTSTLYSTLLTVRGRDKHVVTLEDPVEIGLVGITQVQVQDKAGLSFAAGLRSILRQDPDVILVGEVRDSETARLALQASLTGHLVLTTLHTNDAIGAVARLLDMGAEPFLVASALTLVVAQRLVRKPCLQCRVPAEPSPRILDSLGLNAEDVAKGTLMVGRGCNACAETGYRGRTGVFEVLPVTDAVRSAMNSGGGERALAEAAGHSRQMNMRHSGIAAALRGDTTLEEVLRVTSEGAYSATPHCPNCHREVGEDMACCPWCGTATGILRCDSCSRELDPSWTHCPYCKAPAPITAASVPFLGHPPVPPASQ